MFRKIIPLTFQIILFICFNYLYASNEISVLTSLVGSSKPGYLKSSVLVVEPHGGYVEQSLYLEYTDNNQFPGHNDVEIVHRFELPEGSVVNDMWLWIGDSVMQAIILDTWTATAIYDSIVTNKRDPALLKKKGNQYELHIYPLSSGGFRKVKINFITPTKWVGADAYAELPFKMLNANNASQKPLNILFRQKEELWGKPAVIESPQYEFEYVKDTSGYNYSRILIDNISYYNSLNLSFTTNFMNGNYFTLTQDKYQNSLFQLGILPADFFDLKPDSTKKKIVFGIDLSGQFNKNLTELIPNLSEVINSSLKEGDSYKVIIAGAEKVKDISKEWKNYPSASVGDLLSEFASSSFADSISTNNKPYVVFCDDAAEAGWSFDNILDYASVDIFNNIVSASKKFSKANVIAAYRHGYDDFLSVNEYNMIMPPIDSFLERGGTFLTYFDRNRNVVEKIASHYIQGLTTKTYSATAVTLYRNPNGNLASRLPQEIDHNFAYTLGYNDESVKIELMNAKGEPVIISKKIGNGLLIVSGIWQIKDDGAMKSLLNPALLGLNKSTSKLMLSELLNSVYYEYQSESFDKCILFSNSDSLYSISATASAIDKYFTKFSKLPSFNFVNLLNSNSISAPFQLINNETYYGSGYLFNQMAYISGGLSFETNQSDWNFISSLLSSYAIPQMDNIYVDVKVDGGIGKLEKFKEVNPIKNDPNKPLFYLGKTDGKNSYNINVTASFKGIKDPLSKQMTINFESSSNITEPLIPSLIANEDLKDLFKQPVYDTLAIVTLAKQYNLLCDYTAFLALEPNSTIHFMSNPFDESAMTGITDKDEETSDSLSVQTYPNPFNSQTIIKVRIKEYSKVNVAVYNMLGQRIIEITDNQLARGEHQFRWNGRNDYGSFTSSGIYILRVYIEGLESGTKNILTKKLLYLK